jgi:hypothetical protein
VEALHYAVVCIEKWDMSQYEVSYPRVYKLYKLVDTREKVKKFLVGRQFFVIFVVFLIAQITSFPHIPSDFGGLPPLLVTIIFQTGLPGIAITLTYGQLVSQIYVEAFTLQFLNMYGTEFCVRLSLAAEWIGVCNFSWLLFHIVGRLFCLKVMKAQNDLNRTTFDVESDEAIPSSPTALNREPDFVSNLVHDEPYTWFDYLKYCWSTVATLGAVLIVCYGIYLGNYVLPTPVIATYCVFILALIILFYLEGMMIAIVATQYWNRETWKEAYPRAYALHEIINRPDNVKRFIIGRQFCTVLVSFLIAQVTTFNSWSSDGYNPYLFYVIVRSGLVGVLIVLSFGQLMPELLAQEYPLRFMNMRGSYSVGVISLVFDAIGVGHCAWAFYFCTRRLFCRKHYAESKSSLVTKEAPGMSALTIFCNAC